MYMYIHGVAFQFHHPFVVCSDGTTDVTRTFHFGSPRDIEVVSLLCKEGMLKLCRLYMTFDLIKHKGCLI